MREEPSVWNKELQCYLNEEPRSVNGEVVLLLASGSLCDMCGAIRVARRLSPEVRVIQSYSGDVISTRYCLSDEGVWESYTWNARDRWVYMGG